jgi:hypothetical protein
MSIGTFSVTVHLSPIDRPEDGACLLTSVYGPTDHGLPDGT